MKEAARVTITGAAGQIGYQLAFRIASGQLLGATPRKQQLMQVIGVLSAAFVIAPVLTLLHTAYTIGSKELSAPQAGLMKSVAEGVFEQDLPWAIISIGALIAVAIILVDLTLEARKSQFRTPVLAVAVGIYLPFELSVPIVLGGLVAWFVARGYRQRGVDEPGTESGMRNGLLLAAGLITGEALLGILLAIPIALKEGKNPLMLDFEALPMHWPGAVFLVVVIFFLYRFATVALRDRETRDSA